MTNLTSLYKLPSPELLVGAADGPDAVQQLATRVERELPQMRRAEQWSADINVGVTNGTSATVYGVDSAIAVIGWIQIDAHVQLINASLGVNPQCAGTMKIQVGGAVQRSIRWHNHGLASSWDVRGTALYNVVAGQTTVPVSLIVQVDSSSYSVYAWIANIGIGHFGAPASG